MIKVINKEPVEIAVGDVIEFSKGIALIAFNPKADSYPFHIVEIDSGRVINSHSDLLSLSIHGCSIMGKIIKVHKTAELILGGSQK